MEMTLRWYGSKFDTVTLKDVEKLFYEMRTDYEKGSDD